jgi:hypothetical protein
VWEESRILLQNPHGIKSPFCSYKILNLLTYGSSHIQAERRKQTGIASENKIF